VEVLLLIIGGIGHLVLWVALVNRIHALGIHRIWIDLLTGICGLMLVGVPAAIFIAVLNPFSSDAAPPRPLFSVTAWSYIIGCSVLAIVSAFQRWQWRRHSERTGSLLSNHTSHSRPSAEAKRELTAPGIPTWLSQLPFNDVLDLCLQEKRLAIPRLTVDHDGIRIVHISDLHMSGRLTKAYYRRVVEMVNDCNADLVALTGDIVERKRCIDWIPETLGKLRAQGGVYYVLGNHDLNVDEHRLKAALADAGLIHVGGICRPLAVRGTSMILAGNELPWYEPAANMNDCPPHDGAGLPLRVVLSHSPDQFAWAQACDVDLVMAGHVHGGQVRLPLLGPITAPSLHGVRYVSGVFRAGNTVMHVSRGTGSLTPLRYDCPPEIALLRLCSSDPSA
jgi:uncharacterized protein